MVEEKVGALFELLIESLMVVRSWGFERGMMGLSGLGLIEC